MTYDIAIIGAGCAGLSLAYQLSKVENLNKKIIILDNKSEFKKDRTWSFWKTNHHDFEDCLEKQWFKFNIKYNEQFKSFNNFKYPYQTIDSLKFYKKIQNNLKDNFYIKLDTNITEIKKTSKFYQIETNNGNIETKLVFDSRVPKLEQGNLYQHFYGLEIETKDLSFNNDELTLMDFDCEQKNGIHFFYILPFNNRRALIETTWLSNLEDLKKQNYVDELKEYIENNLKLKNYNIIREEIGAIPMFRTLNKKDNCYFNIGLRGNINRMSTGYAFPYIQKHSTIIAKAIENLSFDRVISMKYEFLDRLFVKVLQNNMKIMPNIFFKMFDENYQNQIIRFLSSEGSLLDDYKVIKNMPKSLFLKNLFI